MSTVGAATDPTADKALETRARGRWADPLILFALGAFAVTQPILSDFRAGAGYFVARRYGSLEIVLLVLVVTMFPGLIANLLVWAAAGFSPRARAVAQTICVGTFVALISQTTLARISSLPWAPLMLVSLVVGILGSVIYERSGWFRTGLLYLSPAPIVFALFFLLTPPIFGLTFPASPPPVDVMSRTEAPVVFLVFDELPVTSLMDAEGRVDADLFPNFARLAAMSTWYKYTGAAHDSTLWAVPALLSGMTPASSSLPTVANYPGNLFTLLEPTHEMNVLEPYTFLCPPRLCPRSQRESFGDRIGVLMTDAMRLYGMTVAPDDRRSAAVADFFNEFLEERGNGQDSVIDHRARYERFLDGINSAAPQLNFAHLLLPHAPYRYYASGSQYNDASQLDGLDAEVWIDQAWADQAYQRHLLQLQTVDQMVGSLFARLEETGLLDESLLVVTADHGMNFQIGEQRRALETNNAYEIGMVPLFVKAPHQSLAVVDSIPSRTIDLLPTLADHLGLELTWEHDGRSLLEIGREAAPLIVQGRSGNAVTLTDVEEGVAQSSTYLHSLLGDGQQSLNLYSLGVFDSVLNTNTESIPFGSSTLTASVDEIWRVAHVSPKTGLFVPGFIHGQLSGDVESESGVGIALNGRVLSVVPVFDVDADGAKFSAIIPDEAFHTGFNQLEVFEVSGSPGSPILEAIDLPGNVEFTMERARSGRVTRLVGSDGTTWPIEEESPISGNVDEAAWFVTQIAGGEIKDLVLNGWAIEDERIRPAESVVFFVDGTFAGSTLLDLERPDIEDSYADEDALMSGFVGRLSDLNSAPGIEIQAFALSDGVAEELTITDEVQADIAAG